MAEVGKRRSQRVAELIRREIAVMLARDLKDPRLEGITVTRVSVASDLRHCRVLLSHLEGEARVALAIEGFQRARGLIRHRMSRELGLRYAPEIVFEYDQAPAQIARLSELLREG